MFDVDGGARMGARSFAESLGLVREFLGTEGV